MRKQGTFYFRRQTGHLNRVVNWVDVSASKDFFGVAAGELCLKSFRRVFGFTPRKGKLYSMTATAWSVEEVA